MDFKGEIFPAHCAFNCIFLIFPDLWTGAVLWPWALIELLAGDYRMALSLMIIWGVAQLLRQIIQPKIVGDSIGVPPVPTLFLLFIGYKIGSVLGMILGGARRNCCAEYV